MQERKLKRLGLDPSIVDGSSMTIRRISEQQKRLNAIKMERDKKKALVKLFKAAEWADGLKTDDNDPLEKEWAREFDLMRHVLHDTDEEHNWRKNISIICEAIKCATLGDYEFAEYNAGKLGISDKLEWNEIVAFWKRNS